MPEHYQDKSSQQVMMILWQVPDLFLTVDLQQMGFASDRPLLELRTLIVRACNRVPILRLPH